MGFSSLPTPRPLRFADGHSFIHLSGTGYLQYMGYYRAALHLWVRFALQQILRRSTHSGASMGTW